jgi:hypothetical protein
VPLPQAWITHVARQSHDAVMRRGLVQAYWGTFTLTTLALLRAQVTPGGMMSPWNWLNIAAFLSLSVAYAYFAFFEKVRSVGATCGGVNECWRDDAPCIHGRRAVVASLRLCVMSCHICGILY